MKCAASAAWEEALGTDDPRVALSALMAGTS